jgi:hypothetical protein
MFKKKLEMIRQIVDEAKRGYMRDRVMYVAVGLAVAITLALLVCAIVFLARPGYPLWF